LVGFRLRPSCQSKANIHSSWIGGPERSGNALPIRENDAWYLAAFFAIYAALMWLELYQVKFSEDADFSELRKALTKRLECISFCPNRAKLENEKAASW
jgi:hypothetical protein